MDNADKRILRALQQNPDLTMRELGEATGLSPTPCWLWVQKWLGDWQLSELESVRIHF